MSPFQVDLFCQQICQQIQADFPKETKQTPTTHIRDLAALMATQCSCPHRIWHGSRHSDPIKSTTVIDADPTHASRVRRIAADLENDVAEVYSALRNAFEVSGSRSGARLKGRPDIITRSADGLVAVYDVQDGEAGPADELIVKLCMYLLPRSNNGRWRGSNPAGCVLYPDGSEKHIAADEIDAAFADRVATVMRQIASDEPAPYRPSATECGRCPLTAEHCSERVEVAASNGSSSG